MYVTRYSFVVAASPYSEGRGCTDYQRKFVTVLKRFQGCWVALCGTSEGKFIHIDDTNDMLRLSCKHDVWNPLKPNRAVLTHSGCDPVSRLFITKATHKGATPDVLDRLCRTHLGFFAFEYLLRCHVGESSVRVLDLKIEECLTLISENSKQLFSCALHSLPPHAHLRYHIG